MLLWINGPFGGGKTQTAFELQRRLLHSVVCDPEHLGFGLRRMMPAQLRSDFQDFAAWRQGVVEVLDLVLSRHDGDVIVPMTVIEPVYAREILGALRDKGHEVRHYALLADRATILRRLRRRSLPLLRDRFAEAKLDECLDSLRRDDFAEHIWTAGSVPQIAIAASAGLTLSPDTSSALRARVRQTWITVKHIRFD
ncbi:AAA family ATPase [Streptomyces scopuliridis]|uniref:AAA family ATPase n=1 Tax=Streptomyces scopuliridis TaxID=452529 RepID=UPI00342238FA